MSTRTKELDVDFIEEQEIELTLQEQQAISDFIGEQKEKRSRQR